jgi:hypothetical protein
MSRFDQPRSKSRLSGRIEAGKKRPSQADISLSIVNWKDAPMKKFMVLYMANGAEFERMMKNSTAEQQKKGMDAWMKWMGDHKASLVDGGAPLGKTKRVDAKGASDTKNDIGGYSIVQAETADAAATLFGKDHPHLQMPGAWVEIIEVRDIPGM